MWNGEKSISLSKLCVLVFMLALIAAVVSAPWLTSWFVDYAYAEPETQSFFLATIYIGSVPAAYLLYKLLQLLRRIEAGQVFVPENVECLRRISWTCFVGAVVALASGFYYLSWLFIFVAASFMGLIVRVVKNVVAQAVALKDEADYTI